MSQPNSHRQILRSSSIIGGAAVVAVGVGLVSTKVVAVTLGPAGVGLVGLLQSLVAVAASIAALGFANVGTRQLAAAAAGGDEAALRLARHALAWGTCILAITGGLCFWAMRSVLAMHVLDRPDLAPALAWLSIAVALTVAAGSQTAALNGLRRVGDLARRNVGAAVLSAAAGITALVIWRADGIVLFILAGPLASFAVGLWFLRHPGTSRGPSPKWAELATEWKGFARLGMAFMLSGVVEMLIHLSVRTMVQQELGAASLGLFQAAWTISMTYIAFVLNAMTADYYPRLAGLVHSPAQATRLVNEQTEVALLLAGPVLLAVLGFAPFILSLLYADAFVGASAVLRWQVLGDVLKVVSWPIAFVFLAAGDGRTFFLTETLALAVYGLVSWFLLPVLGVEAVGVGFFAMYAVYLPLTYRLAARKIGFRWERGNVLLLAGIGLASCLVALISCFSATYAAFAGGVCSFALGMHSLARLAQVTSEHPEGAVPGVRAVLARWRRRP